VTEWVSEGKSDGGLAVTIHIGIVEFVVLRNHLLDLVTGVGPTTTLELSWVIFQNMSILVAMATWVNIFKYPYIIRRPD